MQRDTRVFSKHLSQNGADVVFEAVGDYSSGAVYWELRPSASQVFYLARLHIRVVDGAPFSASGYGSGSALTNGITLQRVRGTGATATVLDSYTDLPVLTNACWAQYLESARLLAWGVGDSHLAASILFPDSGNYLELAGHSDDAFRVVLNDDFSEITSHNFTAQGWIA
jgi:hypothetical protein